jgi:hypothetical protein
MTLVAALRPEDFNLPLFLHLLGAMALVGVLVLGALSLASARAGDSAASLNLGYRSLLWGAIPAWVLMRAGAQWIASKEGLDDPDVAVPSWVDIGFLTSEPTLVLIAIASICAALARRRQADGRPFGSLTTAAIALVVITLLAYLVAIWAMSAKPT